MLIDRALSSENLAESSCVRNHEGHQMTSRLNESDELRRLRSMRREHAGIIQDRSPDDVQQLKIFHNASTRSTPLDPVLKSSFGRLLRKNVENSQLRNSDQLIPNTDHADVTKGLIQILHPVPESWPPKTKRRRESFSFLGKGHQNRSRASSSHSIDCDGGPLASQPPTSQLASQPTTSLAKLSAGKTPKTAEEALLESLSERKNFVRALLSSVPTMNHAFDKIDKGREERITRGDLRATIAKLNISVPSSSIFKWLADGPNGDQSITRELFLSKVRIFAWYLGINEFNDNGNMGGENCLELTAPLLGQRCLRPFFYYKIRHPLHKVAKMVPLLKNVFAGSRKSSKKRHTQPSPSTTIQRSRASLACNLGSTRKSMFSPVSEAGSRVSSSFSEDEIARNVPNDTLRKRGGTLIFGKKEQKELRDRIEFFCLDEGRTPLRHPNTGNEARHEFRAHFIRLRLYPNLKVMSDPASIEPTVVYWKCSEIKDMPAFYSKASSTAARPQSGPVAAVYSPLLRRIKSVDELTDGGSYLLTAGDAVEYPLPLMFQEEKDILDAVEEQHQLTATKVREYFARYQSSLLLSSPTAPTAPAAPRRKHLGGQSVHDALSLWGRGCNKLIPPDEINVRHQPAYWVTLFAHAGLEVTLDFFWWLSRSSSLTMDELLGILDRTRNPPSPRTVPSKNTARYRSYDNGPTFQSRTLTDLMAQIFPAGQSAASRLNNVQSNLKDNRDKMSVIVHQRKPLRLPKISSRDLLSIADAPDRSRHSGKVLAIRK